MGDLTNQSQSGKPPLWFSVLLCAEVMVGVMGWLRLGVYGHTSFPIGFGAPIVVAVFTQHRWLVWNMVAIFVAMTLVKFFFINVGPQVNPLSDRLVRMSMVMADTFLVAYIADLLIRRRFQLMSRGQELMARNEEVARQNEELQNRSEEMEQQSDELRVAPTSWPAAGAVSEAMLELSRTITADMTRGAMFYGRFQAMQRLIPAISGAVISGPGRGGFAYCFPSWFWRWRAGHFAIAETENVCQPDRRARSGRVSGRRRKSFTDLQIPQPRGGAKFKAVVAAPLRMRKQGATVLEAYRAAKHAWSADEVLILEKMAAQASTSMTASDLFSEVDEEHSRLQAVLETVPFGISIVNGDATKIQINAAGSELMGVPSELQGEQFGWPKVGKVLRDGKELKNEEYTMIRVLRGETTGPVELELKFHDGHRFSFLPVPLPFAIGGARLSPRCRHSWTSRRRRRCSRIWSFARQEAEETSVREEQDSWGSILAHGRRFAHRPMQLA